MMEKNAKIYVAGHRGMVGSAIVRELERQGYTNIITRTHKELDLCRQDAVEEFFAAEKPEYVFLAAAKVGGIMAAKRTSELIPLCHPLNLNLVDVRFEVRDTPPSVRIEAETRTTGPTGVEMEAIIAAQVAAATIYDMCKAVQKDMVIRDVRLVHKSGGRTGTFERRESSGERT